MVHVVTRNTDLDQLWHSGNAVSLNMLNSQVNLNASYCKYSQNAFDISQGPGKESIYSWATDRNFWDTENMLYYPWSQKFVSNGCSSRMPKFWEQEYVAPVSQRNLLSGAICLRTSFRGTTLSSTG